MKLEHGRNLFTMMSMAALMLVSLLGGCGPGELRPVEIFPEDNCALCRMAISDQRFASEIITVEREVFKFDDISCFLKYRKDHASLTIAAMYLKTFDTKEWIPYERAAVIESGVDTPMGSGKVAFGNAAVAREFQQQHPSKTDHTHAADGCCGTKN